MKRRQALTFACALGACTLALAQSYPNKVIKLQVPFAPGGTTDVVARIIASCAGVAPANSQRAIAASTMMDKSPASRTKSLATGAPLS